MNYLAHSYLSFGNEDILVGNMIADYVKGKKQYDFSDAIQKGIRLHRIIDEFTDKHKATLNIKKLFQPSYRLYASACVDVVYDYFLANDTQVFANDETLFTFSQTTYSLLEKNLPLFPEKFSIAFTYMQQQNWLFNYKTKDGMKKSFTGLLKRSKYIAEIETAFSIFLHHQDAIEESYNIFFPELENMCRNYLQL